MKSLLTVSVLALALVGCASNKIEPVEAGPISAINSQKLTTSFKRQGIKMGWDCSWYTKMMNPSCSGGKIAYIEVTGYAPSFGNSENNREIAFGVAADKAKAKLRHFIQEDVYSSRVTNTLSKNVEKATDRIKSKINAGEDVEMSDEDASKDTNHAIRENTNDTVRTITENIRVNASGILRGVHVIDEIIVDRQTVAVTIRWDSDSENASKYLTKKFR